MIERCASNASARCGFSARGYAGRDLHAILTPALACSIQSVADAELGHDAT
jgi:hypothetical protein